MMSGAKKMVPKRRFKEFLNAGDWEQRKFKDIAFKRGKFSEADLPYVEFEDINSGIGTLNKNISQKVGHKKGILFETGDVLFGKLRPYLQNWLLCQFTGIAVGDFWVLHPQNVSPAFLYYLIQSEAYQSVANISSGTKMPRSSWSLVSETQFSIPKYNEANMIGEFFSSIDKNITLHQRKLDKLQATKKALLQEMFPEEGQDKPKRRFKGFTDAWEQRKLGEDILSIHTGTNILGSDTNDGIPLLKMGNLRNGYFDFSKLEYLPRNVDIDKQDIIEYGDFLFNTRNTLELVGKGATWTMESKKFAFNGNIARFDLKSDIDTIFFNYLYNTSIIMRQIHARATGTTSVAAIYTNTLNNLIYRLPIKDEQTKIGNFLQQLDSLIALHQRKLDKLKNLKQAYLNEMFV